MDEYTNLITDTSIPEKIKKTVLIDIALHQQNNHQEIINTLLNTPTLLSLKVLLYLINHKTEYKDILNKKKEILYEIESIYNKEESNRDSIRDGNRDSSRTSIRDGNRDSSRDSIRDSSMNNINTTDTKDNINTTDTKDNINITYTKDNINITDNTIPNTTDTNIPITTDGIVRDTLISKILKILSNTHVLLPVPIPLYFYGLVSRNEYQYFYRKYNYSKYCSSGSSGGGNYSIRDSNIRDSNIRDSNIRDNTRDTTRDTTRDNKDKLNINYKGNIRDNKDNIRDNIRDTKDNIRDTKDNNKDNTRDTKKIKSNLYSDISILFKPLQCKICGLRFGSEEEDKNIFGLHLEEHSRKNRAMSDRECVSREYYCGVEGWCTSISKLHLSSLMGSVIGNMGGSMGGSISSNITSNMDSNYTGNYIGNIAKVRCDGRAPLCCVCGCRIEVVWDDEEDEWVLKDGVGVVKEGEYNYCHRECVM
ncbi:hypothetical protein CWI37_2346p0010 [Hamiltosporidium tvaerminnensis]|uniref:C2H2-type domain-containing protein n=1 Tax=Hamiltosporidium tvaerminnensis TaxID=1176355 RepID=A0A4Q9KT18_9MICR|nr:hypothetical protein LUQ84_003187 [Hamiltosporidium tvaerminnensis]TBT97330.1 hypothetical protein CWI37_2346p0010 [Hamiltosporidium tvaerminnensis]